MFSIFKSKAGKTFNESYFPFVTDIHSHILPGIDDGAPDIAASLSLIEGLMQLGIRESVATPHIIGDMYRNDATTVNTALEQLRAAIKEKQLDFKVSAAAEYMLDDYFLELLHSGNPLLVLQDNIILTEFSYASRPVNVEEMAFNIITGGYTPILAHPERYGYFYDDMKYYHRLKDLGFLLQVNLLSLTGYYGRQAKKTAEYLLKNEMVSFAGTDLHHHRHLEALQQTQHRRMFEELFTGNVLNGEFSMHPL